MAGMTLDEAADWVAAHPEGMEYEAARLPLAQQWAAEDPTLMDNPEFMGNDLVGRVEEAKATWEAEEFDIAESGRPTCDCEPGQPCCLTQLTFGCGHGSARMVLPLEDSSKEPIIVLIADKGANPGNDKIKLTPNHTPVGDCTQEGQVPSLLVHNPDGQRTTLPLGSEQSWEVIYPESGDGFAGTNTAKFIAATRAALFGNIEDLQKELSMDVRSCFGTTVFNSKAHVYPKVDWESSGLWYEIKGIFFTSGRFEAGIEFGGDLSGTYGSSTFSIGASGGPDRASEQETESTIPFIKGAVNALKSMTGGGAARSKNRTYSSVEVYHKVELGNSKFKIAEHPTDHQLVGIEGEITLGFAPMFGINATLDLFDALLTAAQGFPATAGLASALRKAREAAATGYSNRTEGSTENDETLAFSAHAAVTLSVIGELGNAGVTLTRTVGATSWDGNAQFNNSIQVKGEAVVQAEGKVYIVSGSAKARGNGESTLNLDFKTLNRAEQEAKKAKFNTKIEWDGIKVSYEVAVQVTFLGIIDMGYENESGDIVVCDKATLYESDF